MKIKHIFLIVSGALVMLLSSCSNALDMAPQGRISLDDVFNDNDMTGAYLNTCYSNIQAKGIGYSFWTNWFIATSDEAYDSDCEELPGYPVNRTLIGDVTAASHPFDMWNTYWAQIRRCTLFLNRIDNANVNSETERRRWRAEAHILRAYFYSELMKLYGGGLPIQREVFDFNMDFSTIERSSFYDLAQFVMEDCDAALATSDNDLGWRITTSNEAMRMTKSVAWAIKSRIMLYAASPLWNGGENHWEEAYQVTKEAFEQLRDNPNAQYALYQPVLADIKPLYTNEVAFLTPAGYPQQFATAAALINEYFCETMSYTDNRDRETIWQDVRGFVTPWNVVGIGAQGGYKCGFCPTQELVDAYETINGMSVLDRDNPYLDPQHLNPNYNMANTMHDPDDPYQNRDPRFYATVFFNGTRRYTTWKFARGNYEAGSIREEVIDLTNNEGGNPTGADIYKLLPSFRERTRTGYYTRKYLNPTNGDGSLNVSGAPWKHFRFGEIILNYAEAAAEAGHLVDAREAVNLIRRRVAMPEIDETDQASLIKRIRAERRVELAMEEHRYFDIRRWTLPTGNLEAVSRYTTAMEVTRDGAGGFNYTRVVNIKAFNGGPGYQNWRTKHLLLPIPLGEVNRIMAATGENWQNPEW